MEKSNQTMDAQILPEESDSAKNLFIYTMSEKAISDFLKEYKAMCKFWANMPFSKEQCCLTQE